MSDQLSGLPRQCTLARPGTIRFRYVETERLAAEPQHDQGDHSIRGTFAFLSGTWLEAVIYPSVNNFGFQVKNRKNGHGNVKDILFRGKILADTPEVLDELSKMEQHRFILLVEDRGGIERILGSKASPLRFDYTYDNQNGKSGYAITFRGRQPHTPYRYLGV